MALKPETVFKNKLMPKLREIPASWWEKIQQKTIRGTPDILGCVNGTFVAIELKKDKKAKLDELQRYKLDLINNAGGLALVLHPDNYKHWLNKLKRFSKGEEDV